MEFNTGILLILLLFTFNFNPCLSVGVDPRKTNTEFIRTSCGVTTYPRLCFSSLSGYASAIQTSPKLLANTSLSVTLANARSASTMIKGLSKSHGLKPREVAAMRDCVENMSDSVDELRKSIGEMGHLGGSDFGFKMNNIQTWVSAALTNENTCMDGFAGNAMNGNVKTTVRIQIVRVAKLTSNALALVNSLASTKAITP